VDSDGSIDCDTLVGATKVDIELYFEMMEKLSDPEVIHPDITFDKMLHLYDRIVVIKPLKVS
jgi:hypothetical protein